MASLGLVNFLSAVYRLIHHTVPSKLMMPWFERDVRAQYRLFQGLLIFTWFLVVLQCPFAHQVHMAHTTAVVLASTGEPMGWIIFKEFKDTLTLYFLWISVPDLNYLSSLIRMPSLSLFGQEHTKFVFDNWTLNSSKLDFTPLEHVDGWLGRTMWFLNKEITQVFDILPLGDKASFILWNQYHPR